MNEEPIDEVLTKKSTGLSLQSKNLFSNHILKFQRLTAQTTDYIYDDYRQDNYKQDDYRQYESARYIKPSINNLKLMVETKS